MNEKNNYDFAVTSISLVAERTPNPKWKIENLVNTNSYIIGFCIEGNATYTIDQKRFQVSKGDILFFPKGCPHSAVSDPEHPWHFYTIVFNIEFADEWNLQNFSNFLHITSLLNNYKIQSIMSELNSFWTGKRPGYLIKCRSLILDILYYIIRETESATFDSIHFNTIEKIANLIQANLKHDYLVEDLAKLADLSPSHFRLLFKKITGFTTVQYQNHVRINKSRDLLLSGSCNVTEAAISVGYNDIYYFSRLFKKETGISPSNLTKL